MIHIVIPARYASSRLPAKPLKVIAGRPLIWHVYQRALESGIESIVVATDHQEIFDAVTAFGGKVVMTSVDHLNGTDRIIEVSEKLEFKQDDIVVNVQGDEPLIPPVIISELGEFLDKQVDAQLATYCCEIDDIKDVVNPNVVKVVKTDLESALYFSRAPIPWNRDEFNNLSKAKLTTKYFRHIGIYAYRVSCFTDLASLSRSELELTESLEQLRMLQAGMKILVKEISEKPAHGVDTEEDYLHIKRIIEGRKSES